MDKNTHNFPTALLTLVEHLIKLYTRYLTQASLGKMKRKGTYQLLCHLIICLMLAIICAETIWCVISLMLMQVLALYNLSVITSLAVILLINLGILGILIIKLSNIKHKLIEV